MFIRAKKGTAEPFLTLGYDEWICVLEGKILFEQGDEKPDVTANAGQTVFIKEGTRFRYATPFGIDGCTFIVLFIYLGSGRRSSRTLCTFLCASPPSGPTAASGRTATTRRASG